MVIMISHEENEWRMLIINNVLLRAEDTMQKPVNMFLKPLFYLFPRDDNVGDDLGLLV